MGETYQKSLLLNSLMEQCRIKNFTQRRNFDMSKLKLCTDDKLKNNCRS